VIQQPGKVKQYRIREIVHTCPDVFNTCMAKRFPRVTHGKQVDGKAQLFQKEYFV
jgi:hypothetical protein